MKEIQEGADEKKDQPQDGASALAHSDPSIKAKEALDEKINSSAPQVQISDEEEPPFRIPPMTAIAGVLIQHWAEGKIQGNSTTFQKGNL